MLYRVQIRLELYRNYDLPQCLELWDFFFYSYRTFLNKSLEDEGDCSRTMSVFVSAPSEMRWS